MDATKILIDRTDTTCPQPKMYPPINQLIISSNHICIVFKYVNKIMMRNSIVCYI